MKKALLIGINYIGSPHELGGCINDIDRIKNLLVEKYNYDGKNIVQLTDFTQIKPTKQNILNAFVNLVKDADENDTLCFYYSGHGTKVIDQNGDESNGYDEAICPLDLNLILDDDILNILQLLKGANMSMFFDCCHSGTIADLAYNIRYSGKSIMQKEKFDMWMEKSKKINGKVKMFSGCLDMQTSADCQFKRQNNEYCNNGAFTWTLLDILARHTDKPANKYLLTELYSQLKKQSFEQIPQFSCSSIELFDEGFVL